MKKLQLLLLLLFIMCAFGRIITHAQDIIIKTDKTEIKSKVLEITDSEIKYKKFEMLDGPTYDINKTDVFMIIYKNGTKEYMESSPKPVVASAPAPSPRAAKPVISTYDKDDASWAPLRLLTFAQSTSIDDGFGDEASVTTITIELTRDWKIVKDYFNIGVGPVFEFASSDGVSSTAEGGMIYGSGYFSLNKILGKTDEERKGFFPFARFGYVLVTASDGEGDSSTSGTSIAELGIDYKFSPNFGITLVTSKFNAIGAGVSFDF